MAMSLRKIAQDLTVSPVTVMRALRDEACVRPELRRRIQRYASAARYEPNELARGIFRGQSQIVSIVVPFLNDSSQAITAAEPVLRRRGYEIIVRQTRHAVAAERAAIAAAARWRVSGMLLKACADAATARHFEELRKQSIPVVLFSRVMFDAPFDIVTGADEHDGYAVTRRLIEWGHRRIGHFAVGPDQALSYACYRTRGWRRALQDAGIDPAAMPFDDSATLQVDVEGVRAKARAWLRLKHRPSAVFTGHLWQAVSVYLAARDLGLAIGREVSVVSFIGSADEQLARFAMTPPLTALVQPSAKIGRLAAERLLRRMRESESSAGAAAPPSLTMLKGAWLEGASAGPLARSSPAGASG